jgi:PT repeat
VEPTYEPTFPPSTGSDTQRPTSEQGTEAPTPRPTLRPTEKPTPRPTMYPTANPTRQPTESPSDPPTGVPSSHPTDAPTAYAYDYFFDVYSDDAWRMLHGPGRTTYLILEPSSGGSSGSFRWSPSIEEGRQNAAQHYPNSEGIDVYNGILYFVCKSIKYMFELDLDRRTYRRQSTRSGLFDGEPDQLQKILFDSNEEFIFFTEEGGVDAGIHARDSAGVFYTLLESPTLPDETTGLAFSPDFMHLVRTE